MPTYGGLDPGYGGYKGFLPAKNGIPECLRDSRGGPYWPSYVFKTADAKFLLGHEAKNQGLIHPEQVAHGWKQYLGDNTKRYFNGTATASDVLAIAVKMVVLQMEKQGGTTIDGFVVVYPANSPETMRSGLIEGFDKAGIKIVQLITEPAAAAYAYVIRDNAGAGRTSLIGCADLGHGTFDCSILEVKDGIAVPISTEGVAQLGGRDYTNVLEDLLVKGLSKVSGKAVTKDKMPPKGRAELRATTEMAKLDLAAQPSVSIPLHYAGTSHVIEITQKEYEAACEPLNKQMLDCIDLTMQKAGKTFKDLETFVLAGMPFNSVRMQELVADHTGIVVRAECDPGTVVAYGAALHAQNLAKLEGGQVSISDQPLLTEASRHDIGIAVVDETSPTRQMKCAVIVKKNTPLPYELTEFFKLERANQDVAAVDVLEGADGTLAEKCYKMASFMVKGIKGDAQRSQRIGVTFKSDKNGMLTVIAKDGPDGPSGDVSVQLKK